MNNHSISAPKALFLSPDGNIYPDTLICSGVLPAELSGKPCAFSQAGHIPDPLPLNLDDINYTADKGQPRDLCPPCAKQQLANLGHWQGHGKQQFPKELLSLRLFKCRQWFWLVVPGIHDAEPTKLSPDVNRNGALADLSNRLASGAPSDSSAVNKTQHSTLCCSLTFTS